MFPRYFLLFVIRKINGSCSIDFSWHIILNLRLTIVRILKVLHIATYIKITKHKRNSQIHIFNPDCCFSCCLVLRMKFILMHTWTSRNLAFHKDFKIVFPPITMTICLGSRMGEHFEIYKHVVLFYFYLTLWLIIYIKTRDFKNFTALAWVTIFFSVFYHIRRNFLFMGVITELLLIVNGLL